MTSTMTRFREREELARNSALAGYFPAQFIVRLGWEMSDFIDPSGRAQPGKDIRSAIFVHEHTHYLHNVSTLVGAEQTFATLATLGLFAKSLFQSKDGTSSGMTTLSPEERLLHAAIHRGSRHFLQAQNQTWQRLPSAVKSLAVTGWAAELLDEEDSQLQRAEVTLRVSYERAADEERTLYLDTLVIEEGVAYLLESMYVEDHAIEPEPTSTYPYMLLYAIARHYVPCAFPLDVVRLALVALNTTNPGVWLMKNLSDPGLRIHMYRSKELPRILDWQTNFEAGKKNVSRKLDHLRATFANRGALTLGIDSVVTTTLDLLNRRHQDPFFDIPVFGDEDRIDWDSWFRSTLDIAPCDFLVEREKDEHQLLTFSHDSTDRITGRRILDLAIEALRAHLGPDGDILPSEQAKPRQCRYFHCCAFRSRSETPETCSTRPWLYGADSRESRCWYSSGMLGLVAHISQSKSTMQRA